MGFWLRSLVPAEVNFSVSGRQCLEVVLDLKTLQPYLLYDKFIVHTVHAVLHLLLKIDGRSSLLMRWRLRLDE